MSYAFQASLKKTLLVIIFAMLLLALHSMFAPRAHAAYQAGMIIDDTQFLDSRSMGAGDIQNFLVSKNSGLRNMSFTLSCYGSGSTERQLYTSAGARCDTPIPASEIIYYAAQIYGVSPKVILATMQKEQSLTTAPNPTIWQLTQAMGYACPTSGSCDSSSSFPYQIDSGTWALRYHYERAKGNNTWWNTRGWTCGTTKPSYYIPNLYPKQNVTFVDPYSGIQYTTVYIENAATSAFYCYTPHAFNNHTNSPHPQEPKGSSRCYSSHPAAGDRGRCYTGSYNFVLFYELWFGPSSGPDFGWQELSRDYYSSSRKTQSLTGQNLPSDRYVYVEYKIKNTGRVTWDNNNRAVIAIKDNLDSKVCNKVMWIYSNCTRVASFVEPSVKNGEVGTFKFYIRTPKIPGSYTDRYNLVVENRAWFQDIGAHVTYKINRSAPLTKIDNNNDVVFANNPVKSPNGVYAFYLSSTGLVAAFKNGKPVWTGPNNIKSIHLQGDGNLVGYSAQGAPKWVLSSTPGINELRISDEGKLSYAQYSSEGVHINDIWSINLGEQSIVNNVLVKGSVIFPGGYIESANKRYRLVLQDDGNLVKYDGNTAVKQSGSYGKGHFLYQQDDGNLVLYDYAAQPVWSSSRQGTNIATYLQDDRNLVSYSGNVAMWQW